MIGLAIVDESFAMFRHDLCAGRQSLVLEVKPLNASAFPVIRS